MKDNMVQELLLKALLAKQPLNATVPQANNNQRQNTAFNNMQSGQRESLETLLKSLYLNNAPKQTASNTNNTNVNMPQTNMPNKGINTLQKQKPAVFDEFLSQNPDFFSGREVLFEYLNSLDTGFDTEELVKIAQIVKKMEEDAIKRFCAKNPEYARFLQQENSKFLNKLENNSNNGIDGNFKNRTYFSEQDINSMSNDEFLKHENEINAQIMEMIRNK